MKIRGVLVTTKGDIEVAEVEQNKLQSYYDLLECDVIDCTVRRIGSREYDIICDDEGLMKENPTVTAVTHGFLPKPALVGNLFICNHDEEGNWTGLTDEEVKEIKGNTMYVFDDEYGLREVIQVWE